MFKKEIELSPGKILTIETGRLAKLSSGSVLVSLGETSVLATANSKEETPDYKGFLPLQVEYREKFSAAGRFPGGFIKREGRPSDKEVLSARLIDRALRPLFPDGYILETQIINSVLSSDKLNDSDVLGGVASSAALALSDIPFYHTVAEVRVARIDGSFVINPLTTELIKSDLEICIGGTKDTICMLEGEMKEISETELVDAITFGHEYIKKICEGIDELKKEAGKEKKEFVPVLASEVDKTYISSLCYTGFKSLGGSALDKQTYSDKVKDIYQNTIDTALEKYKSEISEDEAEKDNYKALLLNKNFLSSIAHDIEKQAMRESILETKQRIDGRDLKTIRDISIEVGIMPRPHGSALFTRGETQALTLLTLGTKKDEQMTDTLFDEEGKRFMLHYNFPPSSVGEVGRIVGVSRREIGHGNLAQRAVKNVLPDEQTFPYTIRIVSDILESNGSSSMATVCAATLAFMDGGVPITKPVSGIAMGLIKEGENYAILSDILGTEDHLGDMDFKVAGTKDGITACQMDIKVDGLDYNILKEALQQALEARLFILEKMKEALPSPRLKISKYAPQLTFVSIDPTAIGALIGKGGETIRNLSAFTDSEINIEESGKVTIAGKSEKDLNLTTKLVKAITKGPELQEVYPATVKEIRDDLGAIVEFITGFQGGTGLVHFSEIELKENEKVSDKLKVGDSVNVKLIRVSKDHRTGRYKYSYSLKNV